MPRWMDATKRTTDAFFIHFCRQRPIECISVHFRWSLLPLSPFEHSHKTDIRLEWKISHEHHFRIHCRCIDCMRTFRTSSTTSFFFLLRFIEYRYSVLAAFVVSALHQQRIDEGAFSAKHQCAISIFQYARISWEAFTAIQCALLNHLNPLLLIVRWALRFRLQFRKYTLKLW